MITKKSIKNILIMIISFISIFHYLYPPTEASIQNVPWKEHLDIFLWKVKTIRWNMDILNYQQYIDTLIGKMSTFEERYKENPNILLMIHYILIALKEIQLENNQWCEKDINCKKQQENISNLWWENDTCWVTPPKTQMIEWDAYKKPWVPSFTRTIAQGQSKAYHFIADKSFFPRGNTILFEVPVDEWWSNRADITLSKCPWVFDSSQKGCALLHSKIAVLTTSFSSEGTSMCVLEDGQEYYLNIRPATKNSLNYPNVAKIFVTQSR